MATDAPPPFADPDRTARARIRDAAIEHFATHGIAGANLKDIARDAGVSAPLIIHHFGSKDGLRVACDQHVAGVIREGKRAAMAAGPKLDPIQTIRDSHQQTPVLRYLARTLVDSSPHVAELIDEMLDDAVAYMEEGVRSGLIKPSDQPRERAAVLLLWNLGALVLFEHAERLLGADLTGTADDLLPWIRPAREVLAGSVLNEDALQPLPDTVGDHDPGLPHDPPPRGTTPDRDDAPEHTTRTPS